MPLNPPRMPRGTDAPRSATAVAIDAMRAKPPRVTTAVRVQRGRAPARSG
jgi:hypothetical protein